MTDLTSIVNRVGQALRLGKTRTQACRDLFASFSVACNNLKIKKLLFMVVGGMSLWGSSYWYLGMEQAKLDAAKAIFCEHANMLLSDAINNSILVKQKSLLCNFETIDEKGVLFFGDSIVEQVYLPQVSHFTVYNAGVGGARATKSVDFLGAVLDQSLFRLMVLSIGVNDAFRSFNVSCEAFSASYEALVRAALNRKIPVILATIPPLEVSRQLSPQFDPERIADFNNCIMAIGSRHGLTVVDVNGLILAKTAERRDAFSLDGVHLTPAYARFWREAIYAAVRTALVDAESLGQ